MNEPMSDERLAWYEERLRQSSPSISWATVEVEELVAEVRRERASNLVTDAGVVGMADRDELVRLLWAEGCGPGNSIHSWRCEYPESYGPCDCVGELADQVLASDWFRRDRARERAEALDRVAGERLQDWANTGTRAYLFISPEELKAEAARTRSDAGIGEAGL